VYCWELLRLQWSALLFFRCHAEGEWTFLSCDAALLG
jgi:hypothetical protein